MMSRLTASTTPILRCIFRPSVVFAIPLVIGAALFAVLLASTPNTPSLQAAQQRQAAPELEGGVGWLNTDKPVTLKDLRGRIVVLDFWTLCCINCIHTLPDLARIEAQYPNVVVVIGVHSPKFENEKKTSSIFKAILRYEIGHPVVNDADHKIWRAYGVRSWPTLGLIDPDGNIVRGYSGEGNYEQLNKDIQTLIKQYKGKLKNVPIEFNLAREKDVKPIYFPGKVLADAASKRIFIADSTNHRIVITDLEGKKIAIAGSGKEGIKDGKFAEARFSDPQGMCLDDAGDTLYVADRKNHSIRALDLKNETVTRVAGTGHQSHSRVAGDSLKTGLNSPWDLIWINKRIFIAMAGHHQIWAFDPARKVISPYAGSGYEDLRDGPLLGADPRFNSAFAQPSGLATDGKRLFVADSEISAIRALPLPGNKGTVHTIVGEGLFEFGDKNGKGNDVRLQHALGVAYADGKLFVADTYNSKIKLIDPVERTCDTYLGDGEAKTFDEPGGVSISGGKMYIADTNNHRIQVVDMKTKAITTLALQDVEPVRRPGLTKEKK
jgi:thiol-disulfide isomerase/thioredoxin